MNCTDMNTTAAAADTEKPQRGRTDMVRADQERKPQRYGHRIHARIMHPTTRVTVVDVLQNSHWTEDIYSENKMKKHSQHLKKSIKKCQLNCRPEDPASSFLPQPLAWLMSCVLTSPSCRKALPLKSVLSSHHLSECGNSWVTLSAQEGLIKYVKRASIKILIARYA